MNRLLICSEPGELASNYSNGGEEASGFPAPEPCIEVRYNNSTGRHGIKILFAIIQ